LLAIPSLAGILLVAYQSYTVNAKNLALMTAECVQRSVRCSVRKQTDADKIMSEDGHLQGKFVPLVFDVTDQAAIQAAVSLISEQLGGRKLAALINNAGKSITPPLPSMSAKGICHQLKVDIVHGVLTLEKTVYIRELKLTRS
jgi:NADP-dependent 3-hydroxy acid dehydrogenase YdfG